MVRVWGIASGRRTTKDAAPGAFTWREYPSMAAAKEAERDWRRIITVERVRG